MFADVTFLFFHFHINTKSQEPSGTLRGGAWGSSPNHKKRIIFQKKTNNNTNTQNKTKHNMNNFTKKRESLNETLKTHTEQHKLQNSRKAIQKQPQTHYYQAQGLTISTGDPCGSPTAVPQLDH